MKNILRAALGLIGILGMASCKKPSPYLTAGTSDRFSVGQVWTYETRPSESDSRLVIGRIDSINGQNIIHIKITGISLKNPMRPGAPQSQLPHAPISETALMNSVIAKVDGSNDLSGFHAGYDDWHAAFMKGKAGWFTISVADISATIEEAMAKLPPNHSLDRPAAR
ncbi:MAG: hypothetical protein Q8T11_14395 [Elusimicrobiota bacterium]|nr:hypothetical protein [Elusimicrobiota bacterium]